jgi:cytochrome c553
MFRSLILAAALLLPAFDSVAGDAAHGRTLAERCAVCHGERGTSTMAASPSLASQPEPFLTVQMILFREGIRQFAPMNDAMKDISDRDIEDLAAFYASQTLEPEPEPRDAARFAQGRVLSDRLRCGVCHLPDYRGREQMPRLAGQREDYLLHTMQEYLENRRVGSDTSMNAVLYGLGAADLAALAHYLAQQR